jgi:hypothetical protein
VINPAWYSAFNIRLIGPTTSMGAALMTMESQFFLDVS